jgi:hypothetical protein
LANLFAGAISGMPVCHGAGGMTAHRSFGARSGGAPIMLGSVLIMLALAIGATLTAALSGFPVPILAGLLAVAGLLHITLLKDLHGPWHWAMALAVGITGFLGNLAVALVAASTCRPSRTPPGEPGRLTTNVRPAIPHTPRDSIEVGTFGRPERRMASASPGIS